MRFVTIAVYDHRWGQTLCVEDDKGCGYRMAGMKLDGTNRQIASFTVDADELIEHIKNESWERDAS